MNGKWMKLFLDDILKWLKWIVSSNWSLIPFMWVCVCALSQLLIWICHEQLRQFCLWMQWHCFQRFIYLCWFFVRWPRTFFHLFNRSFGRVLDFFCVHRSQKAHPPNLLQTSIDLQSHKLHVMTQLRSLEMNNNDIILLRRTCNCYSHELVPEQITWCSGEMAYTKLYRCISKHTQYSIDVRVRLYSIWSAFSLFASIEHTYEMCIKATWLSRDW